MTEPKLIDPRNLYHTEKFPKQDQDTPALQQNMILFLIAEKNPMRAVISWKTDVYSSLVAIQGSVVQQRLHLLEKVQTSLFNSSQEKKKMQKK